ncbi:MAG TPA: NAC family transcription factor [Methanolinea sp.]|nr:NAC family transcription factor [Methanolinea sp.]
MSSDKEGNYCSVCGGIPPDEIRIRKILVDGKETGIDKLDFILDDVARLDLSGDAEIIAELLKRVQVFNYIPTKKADLYAQALLKEYRAHLQAGSGATH